jgi:hypothetical protein
MGRPLRRNVDSVLSRNAPVLFWLSGAPGSCEAIRKSLRMLLISCSNRVRFP